MLDHNRTTETLAELNDEHDALRSSWGIETEYGRLSDVMLCAPSHMRPVPCCSVTVQALKRGFEHSVQKAVHQHRALVRAFEVAGVRCHIVQPDPTLPDACFARDAVTMTPWGLLELRPAAAHRSGEARQVCDAVRRRGVPIAGRIDEGNVEGGDVCFLRPGLVAIGCSGDRTNEAGAQALATFFERRGWRSIICPFDPHFLHLDTQFTMLDERRALACVDVLDDEFLRVIERLGIDLVPVTYKEVQKLGANILSLGEGRIVAAAENERINDVLADLGYDVIPVDLDQFTSCGGGVHCLSMPLAREAAARR
jgi:N-dimethylarginine dimethylaminohydrolase